MRFLTIALSFSLVGPLVAAQPHRHAHRHAEKRTPETKVVKVPGPTVIVYELNGKIISEEEVKKGLADGSLVRIGGGNVEPAPSSYQAPEPSSESTSSEETKPTTTSEVTSATESSPTPATTSESATESKPAEASPSEGALPSYGSPSGGEGVESDFPDGQIDCDHFPSDYGAVPIEWENLGGWAGIQKVTYTDDGSAIQDIETRKSGPCGEGMMCSYACPPGYLKAQWPKAQGAAGQSVGGIECKNGKLTLPRASVSQKLCIKGTGGVKIHNKVGKAIPVCRTDYPGTESMNIPATLDPESSEPYDLSCPNADNYYQWQGKKTSAQYYVNKAGTSLSDGCTWNSAGSDKGNWAPVNLGVGKNKGVWLSIHANAPTNPNAKLNFNIRIKGDDLNGSCEYKDGTYYQTGVANEKGCTVQVMSGDGVFEFF